MIRVNSSPIKRFNQHVYSPPIVSNSQYFEPLIQVGDGLNDVIIINVPAGRGDQMTLGTELLVLHPVARFVRPDPLGGFPKPGVEPRPAARRPADQRAQLLLRRQVAS